MLSFWGFELVFSPLTIDKWLRKLYVELELLDIIFAVCFIY